MLGQLRLRRPNTKPTLTECLGFPVYPPPNVHRRGWAFMERSLLLHLSGGGPRVVVSTVAFHARVRFPVSAIWKKQKMFLPHPRVKVSIVWSLCDREVACSASDRLGSNFESCVWRTVSSQSSHHPQEVLLAQFILYVHKGGLKPDSFNFTSSHITDRAMRRLIHFWWFVWSLSCKLQTLGQCCGNAGLSLAMLKQA